MEIKKSPKRLQRVLDVSPIYIYAKERNTANEEQIAVDKGGDDGGVWRRAFATWQSEMFFSFFIKEVAKPLNDRKYALLTRG